MDIQGILLGFMTAAWVFTVGGIAYATWRYVYIPWKVLRIDVKALLERHESDMAQIKAELGLRKALALSDEEQARAEARLKARRVNVGFPPGG